MLTRRYWCMRCADFDLCGNRLILNVLFTENDYIIVQMRTSQCINPDISPHKKNALQAQFTAQHNRNICIHQTIT